MYKSVFKRFLKGTISGAITTMGLVTVVSPVVWTDFKSIFSSLAMAGLFGAINGALLALNKIYTWKE